jgi:four helix bundle protein
LGKKSFEMQGFTQLKVWQKSHALVLRFYAATVTIPDHERFGITIQMRRAAAPLPANIEEGCARGSRAEFCQFLHVSAGAASELEYFLLLARDLRLLTDKQNFSLHDSLCEIRRMLTGRIQQVNPRRFMLSPTKTTIASKQLARPDSSV